MKKKLTIISDTASSTINGVKVAYEPVVREVQYFSELFDEIFWLTYEYSEQHTIYSSDIPKNVHVTPFNHIGGNNLRSKIDVISKYPKLINKVKRLVEKSDYVHVRAPSHPAMICMIVNIFYQRKIWYKYAGSWIDSAPFTYNFQRKILAKIADKNNIITVNGDWKLNNHHILPFENPSFSEKDRIFFSRKSNNKSFANPFNLVYVGSLSKFKGIHLVIEALKVIQSKKINKLQIIGTGDYGPELKKLVDENNLMPKVEFMGRLSKKETFECLSSSQFLIIASETEGFPKVISEAMMNGCIPISTGVSCIPQYINDSNGFIIQNRSVEGIVQVLRDISSKNEEDLMLMSKKCIERSSIFTYEYYVSRIKSDIFNL